MPPVKPISQSEYIAKQAIVMSEEDVNEIRAHLSDFGRIVFTPKIGGIRLEDSVRIIYVFSLEDDYYIVFTRTNAFTGYEYYHCDQIHNTLKCLRMVLEDIPRFSQEEIDPYIMRPKARYQ